MQIIDKKIDEIKPYENNPRKNDDAVEAVANSIKEFGFKVPIVIGKDGIIVCGHTRYKASMKLGLEKVPCVIADDLSDEQIKAFRLADNKVAEKAEWDFDLLGDELDDILNIDMEAFGFDFEIEEEEQEVQEDDYEAELPEEPKAKYGDIYKLGNHRLMCGDSTKEEDVAKLMNGVKADMVFTDPPWNVNYGAGTESMPYKTRSILNDSMTTEDFKKFMLSAFENMNQFSKEGCMTYVVMSAQEWGNLMLVLNEAGYHWSSTIIWKKNNFVLSRKDYHTQYEPIYYGWKDGAPRLHPLEDKTQSDVWDIDRPCVSAEHPTMKPVELVARAITNSSNPSDIVLDLFGGSGTTLIASEQTDRQCMMMELDPKYCQVIINRWEEFTGEKAEKIEED